MNNDQDAHPLVQPFAALMPDGKYADQVAAPPYDVVSVSEARRLAEGNPHHFLHVSRSEIDFPDGVDPYQEEVYERAAENFQQLIKEGVLQYSEKPCYYSYTLQSGGHTQTGIAGLASVAAYEEGRIRRHELTRPKKENDRVSHIQALSAQTGPVFLVCREDKQLSEWLSTLQQSAPDLDVQTQDGIRHIIRVISDPDVIAAISDFFSEQNALYVADGHHRSAAATRIAHICREKNPQHTGQEPYNAFLAVIFPDDQVNILDYNRVVRDLGGLSAAEFLRRLTGEFLVEESPEPVSPSIQGQFGLYLPGRWYRLTLHQDQIPQDDPVARLDVSLLTERILRPVLNLGDLRTDERIDFVGGIRGLSELESRVDSGDMAVAFSLYPTRIEELLAVADAGLLMPPKSTWFEPKLADGLLSNSW